MKDAQFMVRHMHFSVQIFTTYTCCCRVCSDHWLYYNLCTSDSLYSCHLTYKTITIKIYDYLTCWSKNIREGILMFLSEPSTHLKICWESFCWIQNAKMMRKSNKGSKGHRNFFQGVRAVHHFFSLSCHRK